MVWFAVSVMGIATFSQKSSLQVVPLQLDKGASLDNSPRLAQ